MCHDSSIIIVDEKELVVEISSDTHGNGDEGGFRGALSGLSGFSDISSVDAGTGNENVVTDRGAHKYSTSEAGSNTHDTSNCKPHLAAESIPHRENAQIPSSPQLFVNSTFEETGSSPLKKSLFDSDSDLIIFKEQQPPQTREHEPTNTQIQTQSQEVPHSQPSHETPSKKSNFEVLDFKHWFSSDASDPIVDTSSPFRKPIKKRKTIAPKKSKEFKVANKVNRSKDELLAEMILQIPDGLQAVCPKSISSTIVNCEYPIITWKRRITAKYNPLDECFVPCPMEEQHENRLLIYLRAPHFIDLVSNDTLSSYIKKCLMESPNTQDPDVIILVEAYEKEKTRIRSASDRQFQQAIRQSMGETVNSKLKQSMSLDTIEHRINKYQVLHGFNIFYTKNIEDSQNWLKSLTYTVANSRYIKNSSINLNVKSGVDGKSIFLAALQQFKFITNVRAEQIFAYYPSFKLLYQRYRHHEGLGKCDDNSSNIVPPSTDLAMKTFFLSTDPDEILE